MDLGPTQSQNNCFNLITSAKALFPVVKFMDTGESGFNVSFGGKAIQLVAAGVVMCVTCVTASVVAHVLVVTVSVTGSEQERSSFCCVLAPAALKRGRCSVPTWLA